MTDSIVLKDVWSIFLPLINVKCNRLDRPSTNSGLDETIIKVTLESMIRKLRTCSNIYLTVFARLVIAVS